MITRGNQMNTETRTRMRGGEGEVLITKLSNELPEKARLFARLTLAPGASIGYHVHEGETELFYFLSGEGSVRDDDETYAVCAGDCMATASGHGHGVMNTGKADLVLIAVIVKD